MGTIFITGGQKSINLYNDQKQQLAVVNTKAKNEPCKSNIEYVALTTLPKNYFKKISCSFQEGDEYLVIIHEAHQILREIWLSNLTDKSKEDVKFN